MKTVNPQIRIQQTQNTRNKRKVTPRHIVIKLLKTSDKESNLKSSQKGKSYVTYKIKKYITMTDIFHKKNNANWKTGEQNHLSTEREKNLSIQNSLPRKYMGFFLCERVFQTYNYLLQTCVTRNVKGSSSRRKNTQSQAYTKKFERYK